MPKNLSGDSTGGFLGSKDPAPAAIKIFSVLNNFGLFKSLKPITVNFLANRMIQELLSTNNNILTYKLEDILVH